MKRIKKFKKFYKKEIKECKGLSNAERKLLRDMLIALYLIEVQQDIINILRKSLNFKEVKNNGRNNCKKRS
jgi:hypothetical protein